MVVDWHISLGNLIAAAALAVVVLGVWVRQDRLIMTLISEVRSLQKLVENMDETGSRHSRGVSERLVRIEAKADAIKQDQP